MEGAASFPPSFGTEADKTPTSKKRAENLQQHHRRSGTLRGAAMHLQPAKGGKPALAAEGVSCSRRGSLSPGYRGETGQQPRGMGTKSSSSASVCLNLR